MVLPNPKATFKALLLDYDALLTYSDAECCYSLSEREIQMLLAFVEYIGWKTRYIATETEIDQPTILHWQGNLASKLMSGCCPDNDKIFRYLPDGTLQSSVDGGTTWEDDPGADVRLKAPVAPQLPGEDSTAKRCAAADNVRDQYKVMRDNTIALLTEGTTVLAIVAGLIGLIGGILSISLVGITFGVLLFGVSAALLDLTPESVAEQIDGAALDIFRCIVYCHMDNTGRIRVGELDDILVEIADQFSDFPETFFYSITATMQATGLNNAATIGVETAEDCEDCECVQPCATATTQGFEFGEDIEYSVDPDTGVTTATGASGLVGDLDVVRWGFYVDSTPEGCHFNAITLVDAVNPSFYYREVGEPDSTVHGPITYAELVTDAGPLCLNLIQMNSDVPFTFTLYFRAC